MTSDFCFVPDKTDSHTLSIFYSTLRKNAKVYWKKSSFFYIFYWIKEGYEM